MQPPMQNRMSIRSTRPLSATAQASGTSAATRPLHRPASPPSPSRQLRLQLEQLKARCQGLESKRKQTLSPVFRQSLENQLKALNAQIQTQTLALLKAQSLERIPKLRALEPLLQSPEPPVWQEILSIWQTLYPPDSLIFPETDQQSAFNAWNHLMIQILHTLIEKQPPPPQSCTLPEVLQNKFPFIQALETEIWSRLVSVLTTNLEIPAKPVPETAEPEAAPEESFEILSFELPETTESVPQENEAEAQISSARKDGAELEVRFDMGAGRSLIRNKMGIVLNQHKKSYQEYLDLGFSCIDLVVESNFTQTTPLQEAVSHFLEAISLNKERHEAYFGLGYLYSLVRDINHALYFLDIAWKISHNPSIQAFITKVRDSYGVASNAS